PVPDERARSAAREVTHVTGTGTDGAHSRPARTTPPVRKLANDLGIDLHTLTGTGPDGIITRDDVTLAAERAHSGQSRPAERAHVTGTGTSEGGERRIPIKGV